MPWYSCAAHIPAAARPHFQGPPLLPHWLWGCLHSSLLFMGPHLHWAVFELPDPACSLATSPLPSPSHLCCQPCQCPFMVLRSVVACQCTPYLCCLPGLHSPHWTSSCYFCLPLPVSTFSGPLLSPLLVWHPLPYPTTASIPLQHLETPLWHPLTVLVATPLWPSPGDG